MLQPKGDLMDSGADIPVGRAKVCRLLALTVGMVVAGWAPPTESPQPTVPLASAADPAGHWSFFNQYCEKCHNAEDWAGGVAFDTLTPSDIPENADTLEKAVRKLRGHLMPP